MKGFRVKYAKAKKEGTNEIITCFEGVESTATRVFYRAGGEKAGSEYHTGKNPSKNPERFYLANGKIEFTVCDGIETEKKIVERGAEIEIDPYVWHATITLNDVTYLKPVQPGPEINDTVHISIEDFKKVIAKEKQI